MNPQILVVDDSLTVRKDLEDAFLEAGFASILCANLEAARQILKQQRISLVVLDILLPDGDGVDLLREIRGNPATTTIPVLLLSTEAEVRDRIRGLVDGASGYIGKPYDRRTVIDRAREFVRQSSDVQQGSSGPLVLIIDDSLTFRETLGSALEAAGYSVCSAETGEEGLRLAVRLRPDAVVVDGQLPGVDGITVVRRLRSDVTLRHIPCLLLTASSETAFELEALEAGADSFVCKDEGTEIVLSRLAVILRSAVAPSVLEVNAALMGHKRVLAVDDSPTFLNAVTEELKSDEFDVIGAHSGEEALTILSTEQVDCILLDLVMPGMTGEEACRRIKTTPALREVPVLILTAHKDQEALLSCLKAGADDYIPKAAEFDLLKGRIRAQLRRKQHEGENRLIQEVIETVRKSEARFRSAFEHTNVGMVITDIDNRVIRVNDAFAALFGYSADEMVGLSMVEMTHPDDVTESQVRRQLLLAGESSHFQMEIRFLRKNTHLFWSLANVSLVRSSEGVPLQYVGQIQDITERKQVEEANRSYNERLRILHQIDKTLIAGESPAEIAAAALPLLRDLLGIRHAIVSLFDPSTGRVERLAAVGLRLGSDGPNVRLSIRLIGDVNALMRGESQLIDIHALPPSPETDALITSGVHSYNVVPMIVDGELIGVLSFGGSSSPLPPEPIGIAREVATQFAIAITQARMKLTLQTRNEELREISQQLWQSAKLATMGELAASIAHELNNPLGTMSLGIEDLLSQTPPDSAVYRELKVMEHETDRMATLVANLLQFSRPAHPQISTLNVIEEIDKTMELSSFFLRKRKVEVVREYSVDLPFIHADRQKLRQVFLNLMVNASDAMPSGGRLTIRARVGMLPGDIPAVSLEFADTGVGIPPESLARIMEPFFTTKPEGQGTGLGLAICRRIIHEHHGAIQLTSEVGKGTTFRVMLPIQNGANFRHLDSDD